MSVYNIVPWRHSTASKGETPALRTLQREVDGIFDNFFRGFDLTPAWSKEGQDFLTPKLDISETDKEYRLALEIPGVAEKDLDISVAGNVLTVKGEKLDETKEEGRNFHRVERSYGTFQRAFTLPEGVDADKIEAGHKHGVVTITIPKSAKPKESVKKIQVKGE